MEDQYRKNVWNNKILVHGIIEYYCNTIEEERLGEKTKSTNRWFDGLSKLVLDYLYLPFIWKRDKHGGRAAFIDDWTVTLDSANDGFAILCVDSIIDMAQSKGSLTWEIEIVDAASHFYSNYGFVAVDPITKEPMITNWKGFVNTNIGCAVYFNEWSNCGQVMRNIQGIEKACTSCAIGGSIAKGDVIRFSIDFVEKTCTFTCKNLSFVVFRNISKDLFLMPAIDCRTPVTFKVHLVGN
ncbi:hypothetical protein RFI_09987 [Reticulomyxa filosa]|uniref:Uncharacterized protein n=1 Tax=Reticulomyxa filosa TaxID=46433 RepID=X6NN53_RETFI|nr:hypothetical protein RFI_09987 [Reticulomyxa filosa]|eukprot:ETO27144.1 hypothetical protein RFI_09987 [Reticulomyxa filosa]